MGGFISWSGKDSESHKVAIALRSWLPLLIQGCEPWISDKDIGAGQLWTSQLYTQLNKHSIGIICVTKDNQENPWLNFEVGAPTKQLNPHNTDQSRVCPLLIGMTPADVTG